MKIKFIYTLIVCFMFCNHTWSQSTLQSKQMIGITPIVCNELNLPVDANKAVTQKLVQIATKNGFGSTSGAFILTANPVVVDKQVTATAPSKYIVNIDISLYVINIGERVIINEITIPLRGIHRLENKAFISAIQQLNTSNPRVRNFMEQARTKIVDYYATQTPTILSKASSMAERENYKGAMQLLSSIPDFIEQYPAVIDLMDQIYKKELEVNTIAIMQSAKAEIIKKDYDKAMSIILSVNPVSPNAKAAYAMIDQINVKIEQETAKADEQRRLELEEEKRKFDLQREDMLKLQKDEIVLEKARIESMNKYAAESFKNEQNIRKTVDESVSRAVASLILGL